MIIVFTPKILFLSFDSFTRQKQVFFRKNVSNENYI